MNMSQDLLNVLGSFFSDTAVIKRQFFDGFILPQPDGQVGQPLIFDLVIIQFKFDDIVFAIEQSFAQKLTSQRGDFIIHKVQIFNWVDFVDIVAYTPKTLVLKIHLPESNDLEMLIIKITQGLHKRSHLNRPEFFPQSQLNYSWCTVSSFPSSIACSTLYLIVLRGWSPLNSHLRLYIIGSLIVDSSSSGLEVFLFSVMENYIKLWVESVFRKLSGDR